MRGWNKTELEASARIEADTQRKSLHPDLAGVRININGTATPYGEFGICSITTEEFLTSAHYH